MLNERTVTMHRYHSGPEVLLADRHQQRVPYLPVKFEVIYRDGRGQADPFGEK